MCSVFVQRIVMVWVDNERILNIVILPSFWETPVAYVLYVLFILIIILVAAFISCLLFIG